MAINCTIKEFKNYHLSDAYSKNKDPTIYSYLKVDHIFHCYFKDDENDLEAHAFPLPGTLCGILSAFRRKIFWKDYKIGVLIKSNMYKCKSIIRYIEFVFNKTYAFSVFLMYSLAFLLKYLNFLTTGWFFVNKIIPIVSIVVTIFELIIETFGLYNAQKFLYHLKHIERTNKPSIENRLEFIVHTRECIKELFFREIIGNEVLEKAINEQDAKIHIAKNIMRFHEGIFLKKNPTKNEIIKILNFLAHSFDNSLDGHQDMEKNLLSGILDVKNRVLAGTPKSVDHLQESEIEAEFCHAKEMQQLVSRLHTQAVKKSVIHILGLLTLITAAVFLLCGLFIPSLPMWFTWAGVMLGAMISIARDYAGEMLLPTEGWSFKPFRTWSTCQSIIKAYHNFF